MSDFALEKTAKHVQGLYSAIGIKKIVKPHNGNYRLMDEPVPLDFKQLAEFYQLASVLVVAILKLKRSDYDVSYIETQNSIAVKSVTKNLTVTRRFQAGGNMQMMRAFINKIDAMNEAAA